MMAVEHAEMRSFQVKCSDCKKLVALERLSNCTWVCPECNQPQTVASNGDNE